MSMAIVKFGYMQLVLPTDQAMKIADIVLEAELYKTDYVKDENDKAIRTHHIYKNTEETVGVEVISDTQYKMYKLAGEPNRA